MADAHAAESRPRQFAGYLPDLRWVDADLARTFSVIGREHGLFADVAGWPRLDDTLRAASSAVLAQHGPSIWQQLGGVHDVDQQPTCVADSQLANDVWSQIVASNAGFLSLDEDGTTWAVRVSSRLSAPGQCCVLAVGHTTGDDLAELIGKVRGLRLYRPASQLLWLIHTAVLEQRSSAVVLPDVLLGQLIWGPSRDSWPANWRRDVAAILNSLTVLHAATVPADGRGWETVQRDDYRLLASVQYDDSGLDSCPGVCPLHGSGQRHRHVRVDVGRQFLGVLELHATQRQFDGTRQYDFVGSLPEEPETRLRQARASGHVKTYSVVSRVLGLFDSGVFSVRQQMILDGLIGEVTRSKSVTNARPDNVEIIDGSTVPGPGGASSVVCPSLVAESRYVSFNGNGHRRHQGYRLVGKSNRGWLHKCGFQVAAGDEAAVAREFFTELAGLAAKLDLVVTAIDPRTTAWHDLDSLETLATTRAGWPAIDKLHLRVYGPEDYLLRLRQLLAREIGFQAIPDAPAAGLDDLSSRMARLGITKAELAAHVGRSSAWLGRFLNGTRAWPNDGVRQQCEAFVAGREHDSRTGS